MKLPGQTNSLDLGFGLAECRCEHARHVCDPLDVLVERSVLLGDDLQQRVGDLPARG